MGYPSLETVQMFAEIAHRDGLEEITENLIIKNRDPRTLPLLSYFKKIIIHLTENELYDEADGYSSGFLSCLDIFRRQINYEAITLGDLEIQLNNINSWNSYLETENLELKSKIEELEKRNLD